jgi:hypothetical protein
LAQSGGDYDLSWFTIDCGGGENNGGDYTLISTIGQADAGMMAGGGYILYGGFLAPEAIVSFVADFIVKDRIRIDRTVFRYECWVNLTNLSQYAVENVKLELVEVPDNMSIVDPCVSYLYIGAGETATSEDTCIIDVDRSTLINRAEVIWQITYEIAAGGQVMQQMSSSVLALEPQDVGITDITGDGIVDFEDLAILAGQWLREPGIPSADIAPPPDGDGMVDFQDFAELANHWLEIDN